MDATTDPTPLGLARGPTSGVGRFLAAIPLARRWNVIRMAVGASIFVLTLPLQYLLAFATAIATGEAYWLPDHLVQLTMFLAAVHVAIETQIYPVKRIPLTPEETQAGMDAVMSRNNSHATNIETNRSWITNPMYNWRPGNIFYRHRH